MNFFESFCDELSKLGQEFEPNSTLDESQDSPYPNESDQRSVPEQIVEEGRAGSPEPDAAAGFAASDIRDRFTGMMSSTEGRHKIRSVYDKFNDEINGIVAARKSYTRALLRSRRQLLGPSPTPRTDLKSMLFENEPLVFETSFSK
jgi:hypothetical protein